MPRRILVLLSTLAAAAALAGTAGSTTPDSQGPSNIVYVETTGTNAVKVRSNVAFALVRPDDTGGVNHAEAYSHDCTDCHTVAVAVQVLFVFKTPSTFSPENIGAAVNLRCTRCATFAYAWQYVANVTREVRPSREAFARIAELRRQIDAVAASDEPFPQMNADLDALTAQLKATIEQQLTANGQPLGHVGKHEESD
jgi:hypothetical protein